MSAFKALLRLALREIRRHPARSALVFLLVALMVGASTGIATTVRTAATNDEDRQIAQLGNAIARIELNHDWVPVDVDEGRVPPVAIDPDQLAESVEKITDAPVHVVRSSYAAIGRPNALAFPGPYGAYGPHIGVGSIEVIDIDLGVPALDGIVAISSGRVPTASDEILLSQRVLDDRELRLGDMVEVEATEFTIVGTAARSDRINSALAVVTPAAFDLMAVSFAEPGIETPVNARVYIPSLGAGSELSEDRIWPNGVEPLSASIAEATGVRREALSVLPRGFSFQPDEAVFAPDRRPGQLSTLIAVVIGIQIALVAAAAFAVGVRRRTRDFGQLLAMGADHGHLRTLVLLEAALLGLLGALVGVVAGVATTWWVHGRGWLAAFSEHDALEFRWNVIDWLGPLAVGVIASLAAAWWPTNRLRSLSATAALSDHLPVIPPTVRTPIAGVASLLVGTFVLVALAASEWVRFGGGFAGPFLMFLAVCAMFFGALAVIGNLIALFGRLANRLPVRPRLVLRNSERHQTRAWMAVGAFVATMVVPIILGASVKAYPDSYAGAATDAQRWVTADVGPSVGGANVTQGATGASGPLFMPSPMFQLSFPPVEERQEFRRALVEGVQQVEGLKTSVQWETLDVAISIESPRSPGGGFASSIGGIAIADPLLAAALGIDDAHITDLDQGSALIVGLDKDRYVPGAERMTVGAPPGDGSARASKLVQLDIVRVEGGGMIRDTREPWILLPPSIGEELELDPEPGGVAFEMSAVPDEATEYEILNAANRAWGAAFGSWVASFESSPLEQPFVPAVRLGPQTTGPSAETVRWVVIGVAAAVAALISLVTAALAAVELDREIGSMIATGAPPSIRRWLLGAQTTYHLGLAAAIGIPLAVLLFWAATRGDSFAPPGLVFPWTSIAVVGIAVPLVVGLAVALLFRSGEPAVSRRLS